MRNHIFLISYFLIFFMGSLNAQIASYNFNGNLQDSIHNYDGSASGTVTFDMQGLIHLEDDGMVILDSGLNEMLLGQNSFELYMRFKLPQLLDNGYSFLFGASSVGIQAIWQEAGLIIIASKDEVVINFSDGLDPTAYVWRGIGSPKDNELQHLNVYINFELQYLLAILDGEATRISFPEGFNLDLFKQALQVNALTIGGSDGKKIVQFTNPLDMDQLTFYSPQRGIEYEINLIYAQLLEDLNEEKILSDEEKIEFKNYIRTFEELYDVEAVKDNMLQYCYQYEAINEPLYSDGTTLFEEELGPHQWFLQYTQMYLLNMLFTPQHIDKVAGIAFEQRQNAPGVIKEGTPRIENAVVSLNGTYHKDVAAELTSEEFVVRPTGYYLAAGDLVSISVPSSIIGEGLSVIVGSHYRNMDYDYIGAINRLPDISVEYSLDASNIKVANPYGGGIYLKVPEGLDVGWFEMTIENAIKSPYFSYRKDRLTDEEEWLNEVTSSGAPWADFESDKFMITIPSEMLKDFSHPAAVMARWDSIMDASRIYSGRTLERPRAEYYSFDTRLVTPAYGAGYPLTIPIWELKSRPGWNPLNVMNERPHTTLLHEMGHNQLDPTLNYGKDYDPCWLIEAESVVHMIAVASNNLVYNLDMESAFQHSRHAEITFEEAALDWMFSSNFRNNKPMIYDTAAPLEDQNMLHYQPRSWAKYADVARLYGWEGGIGKVNGMFYSQGEPRIGVCSWRPYIIDRDEYITAACEALGENLTPLFHYWGINPSDSIAEAMSVYPKSQKIKELIENYRCIVPANWEEYKIIYDQVYDRMDYQKPRYDQYLSEYNEEFGNSIRAQFDYLLMKYGLIGPESPTELNGIGSSASVTLTWKDNSDDETGFLIFHRSPNQTTYSIIDTVSTNTTSYATSTLDEGEHSFKVVAISNEGLLSDGCSIEEFTLTILPTGIEEVGGLTFKLQPNPAKDLLFLNNPQGEKINSISIYDLTGRLLHHDEPFSNAAVHRIKIDQFTAGTYIVFVRTENNLLKQLKLIIQQ